MLVDLGRLDEAMPVLERAAALADDETVVVPARIDGYFNLATVLAQRGEQPERARRLGEQALALLKSLGESASEPRQLVEAWLAAQPG